jgi:hypothetical protein
MMHRAVDESRGEHRPVLPSGKQPEMGWRQQLVGRTVAVPVVVHVIAGRIPRDPAVPNPAAASVSRPVM